MQTFHLKIRSRRTSTMHKITTYKKKRNKQSQLFKKNISNKKESYRYKNYYTKTNKNKINLPDTNISELTQEPPSIRNRPVAKSVTTCNKKK